MINKFVICQVKIFKNILILKELSSAAREKEAKREYALANLKVVGYIDLSKIKY